MKQRVVILGSGESGMGAAMLASKLGEDVFLSDLSTIGSDDQQQLEEWGVAFEQQQHTPEKILSADVIIKSPGIPDHVPMVTQALARRIEVISEIEYAYRHINEGAKIIAITGTNGKTTTTLLTYHLLKSAGKKVALAGNVGYSLAKRVAEDEYDYYVIEVSSFQLDGIVSFRPDVAVLLNITPDHLDRYQNDFGAYIASKFRITENLTSSSSFVYCADSVPVSEEVAKRNIEASLFAVSSAPHEEKGAYLDMDHLVFDYELSTEPNEISLADIRLIGRHNMINTMSAVLASLTIEVGMPEIMKGLKTFENAPHRLEVVDLIDGVRYINDSKATNVDAVYYALEGIQAPIVWIVGGVDKGNDYSQLDPHVESKVKAIICLGKNNEKIKEHYQGQVDLLIETQDVNQAVVQASQLGGEGDVVLLSPACASFDLFSSYEDRGDQFKRAVRKLNQNVAQS